jgi:transcriptional regulator with XRE-family HTH domain
VNLTSEAAQEVRHERARRQWSLRRAAAEAGIAVGTWVRIEGGQGFDYKSLVAVTNAFGWSVEEADRLLRGDRRPGDREPNPVVVAIEADKALTPDQRDLLLGVYWGFVDHDR